MRGLAVLVALSLCGCSPAPSTPAPAVVRPGVEMLLESPPAVLRGKRIGLITNATGVDRRGRSTIDLLAASPDFHLVALFGPEHGIRGAAAPGETVASGRDEKTGLPIYSLYGATRKPTPGMLRDVDALVYDIQDVGVRQYTYVSTLGLAMQAAAEKGIPFVVLDRPDPITGRIVGGNILDPKFGSFVGLYPIASRYGMTVGELARFYNREFGIHAQLTVVRMEGWKRGMWYDETGLPWVNPSPNIRRLEAAIDYPGTVFLEGTNLSEGRGTEFPFEQTGAPWLDAGAVAREMNAMRLPGIRFEAVRFSVDSAAAKYPGQTLPGVRFVITDRDVYRPIPTTLRLIDAIRRRHPDHFRWSGTLDRLAGTDRLTKAIEAGTLPRLFAEWDREAARFRRMRAADLLY
ncbi:MAG TPA: DUF1343 domain-containing protein [Longimicrobiaceae bacterium]|nr:DUF1343 domain-containing protein [Longimicrobiaceae bacterium]